MHERLRHFNQLYQCQIGRVSIRKQKGRWGSASKRSGNLNFNYRIAFLPPALADLLVVHELCHLIEANHSQRFWEQVARSIPDYPLLRKELRRYRF